MESSINTLSKMFNNGGGVHYVLPHFQREYSWGKDQWLPLLRDLFFVYQEYQPEKPVVHFFGLMVVVPDGHISGIIPKYRVVDGQQRLVTVSLILAVLRELAKKKKETAQLGMKIDQMLTNYLEKDKALYKLLPSMRHGDWATYVSIIDGKLIRVKDSLIAPAYTYIHRELNRRISAKELLLEKLYEVLMNCFQVALVTLSNTESPYQIFESLDGKGMWLSQSDLVRNYIAMTLPVDMQEHVFEDYWVKIEMVLREQRKIGRTGQITAFIRHYLAMRRRILYQEDRVYARFRDYIEQDFPAPLDFMQEIAVISHFSEHYKKLLEPKYEENTHLQKALNRLHTMEASMTYPMLLAAYEARQREIISLSEFLQLLSMIENLLIRRYLCGENASILFKWFTSAWSEVEQEWIQNPFIDACRKVIGGRFYPSDRHVRQAIQGVKLYNGKGVQQHAKIAFILMTIEDHLWGGTDVITQLRGKATIEHILPQTLTEQWKADLGIQWEQIYTDYLHTLGNLTLAAQERNSRLSNATFSQKKQLLVGQGLRLNSYFTDNISSWNDLAILMRAEWLTQHILQIWPSLL